MEQVLLIFEKKNELQSRYEKGARHLRLAILESMHARYMLEQMRHFTEIPQTTVGLIELKIRQYTEREHFMRAIYEQCTVVNTCLHDLVSYSDTINFTCEKIDIYESAESIPDVYRFLEINRRLRAEVNLPPDEEDGGEQVYLYLYDDEVLDDLESGSNTMGRNVAKYLLDYYTNQKKSSSGKGSSSYSASFENKCNECRIRLNQIRDVVTSIVDGYIVASKVLEGMDNPPKKKRKKRKKGDKDDDPKDPPKKKKKKKKKTEENVWKSVCNNGDNDGWNTFSVEWPYDEDDATETFAHFVDSTSQESLGSHFVQKQQHMFCGAHAINNIVGYEAVTFGQEPNANLLDMDMDNIGSELSTAIGTNRTVSYEDEDEDEEVEVEVSGLNDVYGNYAGEVIMETLHRLDMSYDDSWEQQSNLIDYINGNADFLGWIIKCDNHWIALKVHRGLGYPIVVLIDSMTSTMDDGRWARTHDGIEKLLDHYDSFNLMYDGNKRIIPGSAYPPRRESLCPVDWNDTDAKRLIDLSSRNSSSRFIRGVVNRPFNPSPPLRQGQVDHESVENRAMRNRVRHFFPEYGYHELSEYRPPLNEGELEELSDLVEVVAMQIAEQGAEESKSP